MLVVVVILLCQMGIVRPNFELQILWSTLFYLWGCATATAYSYWTRLETRPSPLRSARQMRTLECRCSVGASSSALARANNSCGARGGGLLSARVAQSTRLHTGTAHAPPAPLCDATHCSSASKRARATRIGRSRHINYGRLTAARNASHTGGRAVPFGAPDLVPAAHICLSPVRARAVWHWRKGHCAGRAQSSEARRAAGSRRRDLRSRGAGKRGTRIGSDRIGAGVSREGRREEPVGARTAGRRRQWHRHRRRGEGEAARAMIA